MTNSNFMEQSDKNLGGIRSCRATVRTGLCDIPFGLPLPEGGSFSVFPHVEGFGW